MRPFYILVFFIVFYFISNPTHAQQYTNEYGRLKFGFNLGGTYQTSDIKNDNFGLGIGATLEYAFIQNSYSIFGFSLRGRYLYGTTYGTELNLHGGLISNSAINGHNINNNSYINLPLFLNNRTTLNEYSLEAMLKFNKLYIKHGVLFYLFLGGGATQYKSETNQFDALGNQYDYSKIDLSKPDVKSQLKSLRDLSYETTLPNVIPNSFVFTPTVGFGIGYRVAPVLTIALEHKTSLPQTDFFDGQLYQSDRHLSFIQDMYHYTSIGFIFYIYRSNQHVEQTYNNPPPKPSTLPNPKPDPVPVNPKAPVQPTPTTPSPSPTPIPTPIDNPISYPPIITLLNPTGTIFSQPNCKVKIELKIENVTNERDIEFIQNNSSLPSYLYYLQAGILHATIDLKTGENVFRVIAKNEVKTVSKEFILSCSDPIKKITICHKNSNGTTQQIEINENEWFSHASHGDVKGICPVEIKTITICHTDSISKTKQKLDIPETDWQAHQSHGDIIGECPRTAGSLQIQICHTDRSSGKKSNIIIDEKEWFNHASHGDTKGTCPVEIKTITICHIDPNTKLKKTISIPENEWAAHQAHGDILGQCSLSVNTKQIQICHTDQTTGAKTNLIIDESDWFSHAAHGDSKGVCPRELKTITICHIDPNTKLKKTISIPENEWTTHQAHGDILGQCNLSVNTKQIQICHTDQTTGAKTNLIIDESDWFSHAAHGDSKGVCPR
ncbi:MAG: outer membrane protein, partial [Flavobacteriales bacterium]